MKQFLEYSDGKTGKTIDLNARNDNGRTVYVNVCTNGAKEVVELLLVGKNSNRNDRDDEGRTAIMKACA